MTNRETLWLCGALTAFAGLFLLFAGAWPTAGAVLAALGLAAIWRSEI